MTLVFGFVYQGINLEDKELVLHYVHCLIRVCLKLFVAHDKIRCGICLLRQKFSCVILCDSVLIDYSHNGRTKEETIINEYIFGLPKADGEVRLADVLMFMSGSSKVPATGFPKTPTQSSFFVFCDFNCTLLFFCRRLSPTLIKHYCHEVHVIDYTIMLYDNIADYCCKQTVN